MAGIIQYTFNNPMKRPSKYTAVCVFVVMKEHVTQCNGAAYSCVFHTLSLACMEFVQAHCFQKGTSTKVIQSI